MANSDEKVSKFVQAITAHAEQQRQKIHQEVEDFKAARLQEAEQQVLGDAYQLIQKERAALHSQLSREMSRRDLDARKQLLDRRREMMDAVFQKARERLTAYVESPAYSDALRASVREMAEKLPADGTVYTLRRRDEAEAEALRAIVPAGSRIDYADDIKIGGCRGVNAAAGVMIDDTLDTKLALQRDWFVHSSGLTVE